MKEFKTALSFVILGLLYSSAKAIPDDEFAIVEDEDADYQVNERGPKILWPYPTFVKNDASYTNTRSSNNYIHNQSRKKYSNKKDPRERRYYPFETSHPQSPIVEMMKQSMAINYAPINGDIFDFLRDSYPLPKGHTQPLEVYDYVIVGAGSAGSVLAARLSEEKPRATVLVLEAGKPEMLLSDIPMFVPYLQLSDYSWPYVTEPQPGTCIGSEGKRCYWPRGKAVGGTSVTNYMIYTRGRPQDWDRVAEDGNYGWTSNEVLQYFKKSQRSEVKKYKDFPYNGRDGEMIVEGPPFRTGLVEAFLEAGRLYGHRTVDYNAPDGLGFGYVQTTTNRGHRWSTAKAFLRPHKRRRNLHILPEARATKVIIEPKTKRAYAVEYIKNGVKYVVRCHREIILSAGPIASPQLLMLSGVGPKDHLKELGIPVIADLQVGRNLYDHVCFPGVIFKLNTTNASLIEPKISTLPNLIQWLQYGDGLLASPGTVEAIGYLKTNVSEDPEQVPDVELLSLGSSMTLDSGGIFRQSWKISDNTYYTAFGSLSGKDTWSAIPILLHPRSRGFLELRDSNPYSQPRIFPNYFTDSKDMETMIAAIKYIIQLGQSKAFQKYGAKLHRATYPGCETLAFGSYSYWECAVRTLMISLHHQIATCKMGPQTDPEAVVDPELRVYGVEGLRVVDSSVIPRTTSAHTNAPAIMIGEKGADMIKRTWANVVNNVR
ncbi:glucose dehydrogenase [FAD, quinone]-like [Pectinophora gossypiella]|uniref:glucose dehydrogenase [FAD, quinone]-like n=1 Tax=Pectinophora gossypiella TaxID=13191 RepID=UPI00214F07CD|nr:glucose dehydrogenase [FAD, quinone]-like [Pectinophora gossypiella]